VNLARRLTSLPESIDFGVRRDVGSLQDRVVSHGENPFSLRDGAAKWALAGSDPFARLGDGQSHELSGIHHGQQAELEE
jgi:hypothetical protein